MEIKEAQNKVKEFDIARGWDKTWDVKDLLLNITEEGGEMWNLIKWIDNEKQRKIAEEHKQEVEDYIGDTLFLILKIANQANVDVEKSFKDTMNEYEQRFSPDKMKEVGHANLNAGGWDNKNGN